MATTKSIAGTKTHVRRYGRIMLSAVMSVVLAVGLMPLQAFAGDLTAGSSPEQLGAPIGEGEGASSGDVGDAAHAKTATLTTNLGPLNQGTKKYDDAGEHVFQAGESIVCEEGDVSYGLKVIAAPDASGAAVAALYSVDDNSSNTGPFTIPAKITYAYQDKDGVNYSPEFSIPQLGTYDDQFGANYYADRFTFTSENATKLIIPATVTTVCQFGFDDHLQELMFAEGSTIEEIPDYFFGAGASALTSVVLPDSVKRIGNYAFSGYNKYYPSSWRPCDQLTSVTMPANLESIGEYAFFSCGLLRNADLSSCSHLKTIGDKAFFNTNLESLSLPGSLETIGYGAFAWNAGYSYGEEILGPTFTSVTIPASVTSIGDYAFSSATPKRPNSTSEREQLDYKSQPNLMKLASVTFEAGSKLRYIGDYAFAGTRITNLQLPASLQDLGADAGGCIHSFYECTALESVTCLGTNENPAQLEVLGGFGGCAKLTSVTVSQTGIREIASEAFSSCSSLENVDFPVSVERIGDGAFSLSGLKSVTVPGTVAVIGERAFFSCDFLETVSIEQGVEAIGDDAFRACEKLREVTLSRGLKTIGAGAFSACPVLREIVIPATVSRIGAGAFSPIYRPADTSSADFLNNTHGLTSLIIKPGYTDLVIEGGAFLGCKGLGGTTSGTSTIVLPERVTKVGGGAFAYIEHATYEIHNPSLSLVGGEGYLGALVSESDAWFFTDNADPDEDGLCYIEVPDPWTAAWETYKNQQRVRGSVSSPAVVKYPNTVSKETAPKFAIYLEQIDSQDPYRPMFQAVDPSTFAEEQVDPDDELNEVADAGRLLVSTTGAAGSNAYVCVYDPDSGDLVTSAQAGRGLAVIEGLAPGTYTVTAFAKNAGFKAVDNLNNYQPLGLQYTDSEKDYAKREGVEIVANIDEKLEGDNALEVPALNAIATASDYIKSSSMTVSKKDVYKNTQFFATFNYAMKGNHAADQLVLKAPQGMVITSVTSANESYVAGGSARTQTVPLVEKDRGNGRIYVGLKATATGTFTLNASLTCDSKTFPAGNVAVTCNAISLELPEAAVHAKTENGALTVDPFDVDVYAAPGASVTIRCAHWADTIETNRSGHATVTISLGSLETALSYATVVATVTDNGAEVSAQGAVQFAAEQRDPYTLKEFSFVHAGKKYDIVTKGKPVSRSNYYTYVANGKEANKYWSFEAIYITDSPLWIGGRASTVMQTVSCTLQVQMADGSSRYDKMALIGSEKQADGAYLNTFATTLYLDQAGDHVFPASLIPAAFGVSLYAPEAASKSLTQLDIDNMRARLHQSFEAWKADIQRKKKETLANRNASWADEALASYFDEDYSEILFFTRTYIWEAYEDACANPTEYGLTDQERSNLQDFVNAGNKATEMLGNLFDAGISAKTSISECGSMADWLSKNANYKSGLELGADAIAKLADAGWNVTTDDNAAAMGEGGGTPTNGLNTPNPTFREPTTFATKLNKDGAGNIKSMSYRDSNGNSATFNKPFDASVNQKYDVKSSDINWFTGGDCANLLSNVLSIDNLEAGKFANTDMKINNALYNKLGADKFNKMFPNGVNASLYGFGFAQGLNLGQTAVDGYKQYLDSEALIEAFKDADKARDNADNLTIRLNKMIKSGEYKKDPKCYKALKEERNWAIIVADGLKAHAQLSEVEGWRSFGMTAGSGLAGACSGGIGSGIMYFVDKGTGKIVAVEMDSNQSVLGPAMRNLLAAHRQRMIDCGETEDDAPWNKPAILDPSGVVYEAFPANTLEGVTATVYEDTRAEGAQEPNWSPWLASTYDQVNPQTTKADGAFSWDVPAGKWKVKFTKEGYVDAETDAMDVPPPRMGLQQAMVATADPKVTSMTADTKSIEVTFDQYMDAIAVPDVYVNDSKVTDGAWADVAEWVDEEKGIDKKFSKVLRIPVPAGTTLGSTLSVNVGATKNYASKDLAAQTRSIVVAARPATIKFNFPDTISMQAGTSRPTTVRVYDGDGKPMQGLKLTAALDNDCLANVTMNDAEATTDASGAAKLQVVALLPGLSELTVGVEGAELTRTINLLTTAETNQAARPIATIGAKTYGVGAPIENALTVEKGTQLKLNCETEGAVIYYTTDGSCPCQDTSGRKTYTDPITINENTNFIIASYKNGMDYSAKLKLNVTVKAADSEAAKKASTISLAAQSSTYTGKAIAYKGKVMRTGSNGAVSYAYYSDANCTKPVTPAKVKAVGTYYVKATVAADANYTAATSAAVTLTINPKGTKLSKVKAVKKGFTAKWKKQATQTTGYQVQYALNSKFKSAKTVTVKGPKVLSKNVSKLKPKKKYWVRIRTYKKVGGKNYCSNWSAAKKVTTKK